MRTIIAGSRGFNDYARLEQAMAALPGIPTTVISGTARGADVLGEAWAAAKRIPIERYPANWHEHGKRAGYLRNAVMAEKAEALVAFWDGASRGTKHMIDIAEQRGLLTRVVFV